MSSPTIVKGRTWVDGETVTPARLNAHVDSATLNFTATKKLAARVSSGAGVAEEAAFGTVGQAVAACETEAAARTAIGVGTIATQAASAVDLTGGKVAVDFYGAANNSLTYGSTVTLDFDTTVKTSQSLTLSGDVTFATSNLANGRMKLLRLLGGSGAAALTFPAGWTFLHTSAPTSLAAGKKALLCLFSYGTADSDVIASYSVSP